MPWRLLMIVNSIQLRPSDREKVEDGPDYQAAIDRLRRLAG
jgi:hypothetical protein